MPLSRIFNVPNLCFNVIWENKMLAKNSEFTVLHKGKVNLQLILSRHSTTGPGHSIYKTMRTV